MQTSFCIIFKVLVYAIRMVFNGPFNGFKMDQNSNKVVLEMTDDNISKFTKQISMMSKALTLIYRREWLCKVSNIHKLLNLLKFCDFKLS